MKSQIQLLAVTALLLASTAFAQVPGIITYHGVIESNGKKYKGTGQFKFALLNTLNGESLWSNNGSSLNGSEPTAPVAVEVDDGLFTVQLGDTTLQNMMAIPIWVFTNSDVRLRIWFNDGNNGFAQLQPDQRITSVGYAMMSGNVPAGSITTDKLANGAVTGEKIAPNSITSDDVANTLTLQTLNLGGINWDGTLNLFAKPAGGGGGGIINPSGERRGFLEGDAFGSELTLFFSNGATGAVVSSRSPGGRVRLWDGLGSLTTFLGTTVGGGDLTLFQINGKAGIRLDGDRATFDNQSSAGGEISIYNQGGLHAGVFLDGEDNGGGLILLRNQAGLDRLKATGETGDLVALTRVGVAASVDASVLKASLGRDSNGGLVRTRDASDRTATLMGVDSNGGYIAAYQDNEVAGVVLDNAASGGVISAFDSDGTATVQIFGTQAGGSGGRLEMRQANGARTVILDGEVGSGGGGYLQLLNANGTGTITLDSDAAGKGRITTQILEITGGSDLSERFDIEPAAGTLEPGMVVCLDPENPARLVVSSRAYDTTVAGVISGAGGVKPGMLMSQSGSAADGRHPVALTGRVYCQMDAKYGAIRPGDLVTSSDTPGHGMKVTDPSRANGAIIGKAMTGLKQGRGLVLVLVSLQ